MMVKAKHFKLDWVLLKFKMKLHGFYLFDGTFYTFGNTLSLNKKGHQYTGSGGMTSYNLASEIR